MLTHTWVKTLFPLPLPVCQRSDLIRIIYCWFAHLLFYSECYWRFLVHHVLTAILFFSRPLRVKWEWAVNWTKLRVRCSTVKFLAFGASWLQRLSSLLVTGWNISSNAWISITNGWVSFVLVSLAHCCSFWIAKSVLAWWDLICLRPFAKVIFLWFSIKTPCSNTDFVRESVKWNPWFAIPGFLNLFYTFWNL